MKKLLFILATVLTFVMLSVVEASAQVQQTDNNTLPGKNSKHIGKHIANGSFYHEPLQALINDSFYHKPLQALKKLNLLNTKSLVWKWDTIITYDTLNAFLERHTQTFDTQGNVLITLIEHWQTNAWVNYWRETYTYDANGNMLTKLDEDWQTNAWVNSWRETYTSDFLKVIKFGA